MSREAELTNQARAILGDKFNVIMQKDATLCNIITSDINQFWDKWIEEAEKLSHPTAALSIASILMSYVASLLIENYKNTATKELVLGIMDNVYDVVEEDLKQSKERSN